MSVYATALGISFLTVAAIVFLMRSRRIREKYAAAWILLAVAVVVVGVFPDVLATVARFLGVQTPINLLFLVGVVILLVVSVQFSVEISKLEEETRTLAEEVALLRRDLEDGLDAHARRRARRRRAARPAVGHPHRRPPPSQP